MNLNGIPIVEPFSGVVDALDVEGDALVQGNLSVLGDLSVSGTATFVDELKIKDALIELAVENAADNTNIGIIENFNDGAPKYSGLIRDKNTKEQYLIEASATLPTPSTDITTLPKGHLNVQNLTINNYDLPTADGSVNQVITTNGAGVLVFADVSQTGTNPSSHSYFQQNILNNSTQTPIAIIDTYVSIIGFRAQSQIKDFTAQADTLTYTGLATKKFVVNVSISAVADGVLSETYVIGCFVNNILISGEQRHLFTNSPNVYPQSLSFNTIVELANLDTIEMKVKNTTGTQNIVIKDMAFSVASLEVEAVLPPSAASTWVDADKFFRPKYEDTAVITNTGCDFLFGDVITAGAGTRLHFDKSKACIRIGSVADDSWDDANRGAGSFALGSDSTNVASGVNSVAMGDNCTASGNSSVALGANSVASATGAMVVGCDNTGSADYCFVAGLGNDCNGEYAMVCGNNNITSNLGLGSFTCGRDNTNNGQEAACLGRSGVVQSAAQFSLMAGQQNTASAPFSATFGGLNNSNAAATASVIAGTQNLANGSFGFLNGRNGLCEGFASHTEGFFCTTSGEFDSEYSHAEGNRTTCYAEACHTQGYKTEGHGNGSFAGGAGGKALHPSSFIWADSTDYGVNPSVYQETRHTGGAVFGGQLDVLKTATFDSDVLVDNLRNNLTTTITIGNNPECNGVSIGRDGKQTTIEGGLVINGEGDSIALPTDRGNNLQFLQTNGSGGANWATGCIGPNTTTDNAIARWDGTTGQNLNNSLCTISDVGTMDVGGDLTFRSLAFSPALPVLGGLYVGTADKTIANTTTETTMIPSGIGSLTIPANLSVVGNTVNAKLRGTMDSATPEDIIIRLFFGATTLHTETISLANLSPDSHFSLDVDFTIRSLGATGTLVLSGFFGYEDSSSLKMGGITEASPITIDTTVNNTIDITAEWGSASPSNTITTQIASLSTLY